jgi:hypothetical protein
MSDTNLNGASTLRIGFMHMLSIVQMLYLSSKALFLHTLARIIHERFCCNRGFAAATSLDAVGPASKQAGSPFGRSTYCFKYASLPRGSARLSRVATARFRDEPS